MGVFIVGAGLAGLTCAEVLTEQSSEGVALEASDGAGSRVRTDEKDGATPPGERAAQRVLR